MGPRYEPRASPARSHLVGEVEELDVEARVAGVDHGIHVEMLAISAGGGQVVDEVMVVERIVTDQGLDDPQDARQPKHFSQHGRLGIALGERRE